MPGSALKSTNKTNEGLNHETHEDRETVDPKLCGSPVKKRRGLTSDAWEWEEIELDIGWGTLRGKARGSGSRHILGLHGWLDNANTFDLIAPMLPEDARFVSLDLPGHGNSDHFPAGFIYDPRSYVGAVKKAVKVLGWERFIFLGHSMGAVIGILYSSTFAEDVEAFLSIDIIKPWSTPADQYATRLKKYFTEYYGNEEKSTQPPLVYEEEELVVKTMEGSKSLDDRGARIMLSRGAKKMEGGEGLILKRDLRAKTHFVGLISYEVWLSMAKSIRCPLLIIKANEGHHYETKERYDAMLASFEEDCPYFSYKEMEGKHHIHLTHADIVGDYIATFLDKCNVVLQHGTDSVVGTV